MKRWMDLRIVCGICAALGWWGLLYPELTMTPDTYKVCVEESTVQTEDKVVEWEFGNDVYWSILNGECEQVRLRSKLLTDWNVLIEKER